MPAGSYKLIAKSGSATVAGTAPTAVTVNGDGNASNTSATLRITAGELWMDLDQTTLSATVVSSSLVVSWPNTIATYYLETNTSVVNPTGWGLDLNAVNSVGGFNYVTNPMTMGVSNLFFRLQHNP